MRVDSIALKFNFCYMWKNETCKEPHCRKVQTSSRLKYEMNQLFLNGFLFEGIDVGFPSRKNAALKTSRCFICDP